MTMQEKKEKKKNYSPHMGAQILSRALRGFIVPKTQATLLWSSGSHAGIHSRVSVIR